MFLVSALRTSVRATAVPQLARGLVTSPAHRGLEEFIAHPLKEGEKYTSGRGWEASDLRTKSWDDLHKLWYVLLKERNLLYSEKLRYKAKRERLPQPFRLAKVRKSMTRIKTVMDERARAEPDADKQTQLRGFIDAI